MSQKIRISVTRRIWLTVAAIVLIFTVMVLYIVPSQQEKYFIRTFNQEVDNLAKTVALGVRIAMNEQNFEGVEVAIDFAKSDSRLMFVAMIQTDTLWDDDHKNFALAKNVIKTYPPDFPVNLESPASDSVIVKVAPFDSKIMRGEIMAGFKTDEIVDNMNRIRIEAIIVSIFVFAFGILLGLWLARTISRPVIAIRDAALKVGQGDLTQKVGTRGNDEIGDLSKAFNNMVEDLAHAEEKLREKNQALLTTLTDLEEKNNLLSLEKKKSDKLLLNILPEKTADELKKFGHSKPTLFNHVTVLFIDFASFTQISERLSPEELVEELDFSFRKFDSIISQHNLEKIKTIGDAYLCVGGLPLENELHAENCVQAAIEIQEFLSSHKAIREKEDAPFFEARLGIHTGPVVAGIVGAKKFQYDIWGDTVNTASRMESAGEVGKVNISQATYELLKDTEPGRKAKFYFESRGKIEAKGKGEMEMWFVYRK